MLTTLFELACIALIIAGVVLLTGTAWGLVAAGIAGLVWLELPELLALAASARGRKR